MVRIMAVVLSALCLALGGIMNRAQALTGPEPEFKKLADNVYAYVGKTNDANVMVVVTRQGVLLVDTGNSPPDARNVKKHVASVTSQPIRWVVISQFHGDHFGATPLFTPPATMIVHEVVARQVAAFKPYQVRSWRKRFPERAAELSTAHPMESMISMADRMTLNLGGTIVELINVADQYNVGDIGVWLPQTGVLHAAFAGYKDRHPDMRPDYSHGTTAGFLRQLEAFIALKPKIVVPAHGPVGTAADLEAMVDYMTIARKKVRTMMAAGEPLETIVKKFNMNEFADWDRVQHMPWMAETIHRELSGLGPQLVEVKQSESSGVIASIKEAGRYLEVQAIDGKTVKLRVTSESNIEGVADRSELKVGQRLNAKYHVPDGGSAALGYDVEEIVIER